MIYNACARLLQRFDTLNVTERPYLQWYPDIRDWWVGLKVSLILKVHYIRVS